MWHYVNDGKYSVRSAYRMIRELKARMVSSSSAATITFLWKKLWGMDIPPEIKMCAWRASNKALLLKVGVARRVQGVSCLCDICGEPTETDCHALFECSLARELWVHSKLEYMLGACLSNSVVDTLIAVHSKMGEKLEKFVTKICACWQARNNFLFGHVIVTPKKMVERAFPLVREYREARVKLDTGQSSWGSVWQAPCTGYLKVNFDGAWIEEESHGLGIVTRDSGACVVMAGSVRGLGLMDHSMWRRWRAYGYATSTRVGAGGSYH